MIGVPSPWHKLAAAVILGLWMQPPVQAETAALLKDGFKDQNASSSRWTPQKSSTPWEFEDAMAAPSGEVIFDTLRTTDFPAIASGAFKLSVKVKFESSFQDGNNRFFLQMRDSESGGNGYEVTIAQGTSNNTILSVISGGKTSNLSKGLKAKAYEFPTDDFVTVEWQRTAGGEMTVLVDGLPYLSAFDDQFHRFDTLTLGTRAYVPEGESGASAMRQFFTDVELQEN